jgi:hypothetical protein
MPEESSGKYTECLESGEGQAKTAGRFCELRSVARRRCLRIFRFVVKNPRARIGYTKRKYTALSRVGQEKNLSKKQQLSATEERNTV